MGHSNLRPTIAEIDLAHLRSNFRSARDFIGHDLKYLAVVKANAYGHGAVQCARTLVDEGIDWLGVALVEEAIELREAGIEAPILCLGGFLGGQEESLLTHHISAVVFNPDQADGLQQAAGKAGVNAAVHIKIDTGMGRLGIRFDRVDQMIATLANCPNLYLEGLMTHFASADDPAQREFTELQIRRFDECIKEFERAGMCPDLVDMANSPAAVCYPSSRARMVRLGGLLYGLGGDILPRNVPKPDLRPVMSLLSSVADVKSVPRGETLGYGRIFTTERESTIALVPIGYHDGYRRGFSNLAKVVINGSFAPVVGRISMDWTIVDVTDISEVGIGTRVTLIGSDGDRRVLAEDLAGLIGTISYEITCGIGERVPRIYSDISLP